MTYRTALETIKNSHKSLLEDDGNLSEYEMICIIAALDLATKEVARRNHVVLPK